MSEPPVSAVTCPSCGASIKMEGDQGTCDYCGTIVERPYAQRRGTGGQARPGARAGSRSRADTLSAALLVIALVTLVTIIVLVNRERISQFISGPAPTAVSTARRISTIYRLSASIPRAGTGADLLAYTVGGSDGSSARHELAFIDTISRTLRWRSAPLNGSGSESYAVVAGSIVYLTDRDRLLALRASDGSPAWQTSLVTEPPSGCEGCLRVVGERVIVLQKDGSLQGFETRTGALAWNLRLAEAPRRLLLVGGRLVVIMRMGEQQSQGVELIDPASGAVLQQIVPACSKEHGASLLYYDIPVIFSPDGATMYTIPGHSQPCLQRWDLATGQLSAEQAMAAGSAEGGWMQSYPPLLIDGAIVYAGKNNIYSVDAASGTTRALIEDAQTSFYPVAGRDGILVVLSTPTSDTSRWTILGLDMQSGTRRWQFAVQGDTPLGSGSGANWLWHLTDRGLTVVQLPDADHRQIRADVLDLQTGVSAGQEVTPTGDHSSSTSEPLLAGDMIWLNFGDRVYALDAESGKLAYTIP